MTPVATLVADKIYVEVDSLLAYFETRYEEAYWSTGEGFRKKVLATISKIKDSVKPEKQEVAA